MENTSYIELKNITKKFGSVVANNHINLDVKKGEIHALLGENGSGKSTLMNILSGIYTQDEGSIYINGEPKHFHSPKEAIDAKIGMIHQHFKLVEVLSAKENMIAGMHKNIFIRQKKVADEIKSYGEKYGLQIDPDKKIYNMSISEKQTVEIVKALLRGAEILILDEPTAVLTPQETTVLFSILKKMKSKGCSIIIITHKLNEVMEISDRVTILRKGESIATIETDKVDEAELIRYMVGKTVSLDIKREVTGFTNQKGLLSIQDITVMNKQKRMLLNHVSLELKPGEIHGIAGISGSGQDILCDAIMGIRAIHSGSIRYEDKDISTLSSKGRVKSNIHMGFIPEDRLGMGLISGMDITDNILLRFYRNFSGLFINRTWGEKKAKEIIEKYEISTPSSSQIIDRLSGGNIQKVLLGREIEQQAKVLITAYPVRGLDIGAAYSIYHLLNEEKKKGVSILFIGEDLDVILSLCDRISVMYAGKIMATVDASKVTKEELGLLMLGKSKEEDGIA